MKCKFDKSLLQALVDDTADPLEIIFASEHLKVCESCMDELKKLYYIDQRLKSFFNEEIMNEDRLSSITELTIDNLFEQLERKKFKDYLNDTAKMSNVIVANSSRFLEYVPGVTLLRKRININFKDTRRNFAIPHRKKSKMRRESI